jgi:hypothetical protein
MNRRLLAGVALLAALAIPAASLAHEGHPHRVMGTVTAVQGNHVTVKTADGKTVMVMLDAKTKITQGKAKVEATALKAGDRVVAEGAEEKDMIMATAVRLGAPTPAKTAAK